MSVNYLSGAWTGPDSTIGNAHALLFDWSDPQNLPTQYLAYDEKPVTLRSATPASVAFDLLSEVNAVGSVTGTVTRATADAPENSVFVRFTDGAAIEVARDSSPTANFSYVVPTMFVVTSAKQTKLPTFPATSFAIPAGEPCDWSVETHGTYATPDEATGPEGMLDTLSNGEPRGPRHGAGVYTESESRAFTAQ